MDIPGKKGPQVEDVNGSYDLLHRDDVLSQYSVVQRPITPNPRLDIYSDTLMRPNDASFTKSSTLPSTKRSDYQYVDTNPTLVPLSPKENATALGEIRHLSTHSYETETYGYSTVDKKMSVSPQYSSVKPVDQRPYNTLSFKGSLSRERPNGDYDKISAKKESPLSPRVSPIGYETIAGGFEQQRKTSSDDYNFLVPVPLPVEPSYDTAYSKESNTYSMLHVDTNVQRNDTVTILETSPLSNRKNIYNSPYTSPLSSPQMPRKVIVDEYDEVCVNEAAAVCDQYDHFDSKNFKTPHNGVYSKFNRPKLSVPGEMLLLKDSNRETEYSSLNRSISEGGLSNQNWQQNNADILEPSRLLQAKPSPPLPPRNKPQKLFDKDLPQDTTYSHLNKTSPSFDDEDYLIKPKPRQNASPLLPPRNKQRETPQDTTYSHLNMTDGISSPFDDDYMIKPKPRQNGSPPLPPRNKQRETPQDTTYSHLNMTDRISSPFDDEDYLIKPKPRQNGSPPLPPRNKQKETPQDTTYSHLNRISSAFDDEDYNLNKPKPNNIPLRQNASPPVPPRKLPNKPQSSNSTQPTKPKTKPKPPKRGVIID